MFNPNLVLTLAFKNMLYDIARKTGNPFPSSPRFLHQGEKASQRFFKFKWMCFNLFCTFKHRKYLTS